MAAPCIRSKSSGTAIRPARKPVRRMAAGSGAPTGTTLTRGFPALAMMKAFARRRPLDETRQMCLGFVDIDLAHAFS